MEPGHLESNTDRKISAEVVTDLPMIKSSRDFLFASTSLENRSQADSGFILIVVLWIVGLVAAVALAFTLVVRSQSLSSANRAHSVRAEMAADGLARLVAYRLAAAPAPADAYPLDSSVRYCRWDDGATASIAVQDAGGLVDLNTASPELVQMLFRATAGDQAIAAALFADLQDFRDADTVAHAGGSEPFNYPDRGYGPKNGPFAVPEELDQLPGVKEALFKTLVPLTTTLSQQPGIDLSRAPAALLSLLGSEAQQFQAPSPGRMFRIDVLIELHNGIRFRRIAQVSLERQPDRPYVVLLWQRGGDPGEVPPMPEAAPSCFN
jgi:general secretion pathway protein K